MRSGRASAAVPGGAAASTDVDGKWPSLMSDVELVKAVLAGERGQFAVLVERYQRDIFNLAYRSTHNRQDAEDIAQETFLRAFRALSTYDPARPLRTWLYAIAANICRDWARRRQSRPETVELMESDARLVPSKAPQPADVAARRETRRAVEEAVMKLEPDYRLPVVLFYMRGVPQAEIAEIMGLPVSVVKNRLYRARRRLREMLGDGLGEAAVHE